MKTATPISTCLTFFLIVSPLHAECLAALVQVKQGSTIHPDEKKEEKSAAKAPEKDKIEIENPRGFHTAGSGEFFRPFWDSLTDGSKMKGKVSDHLTRDQIEKIYLLELNIHLVDSPGDAKFKNELFDFMTEDKRFRTDRLPERFDKAYLKDKHVVVMFRTKTGDYGLITRYPGLTVIELKGKVGVVPALPPGKDRPAEPPKKDKKDTKDEKKEPAWNPALFEGAFMFADAEAFRHYLRSADVVAVARLTQWDGTKGKIQTERKLRGLLGKEAAFVGDGGLVRANASDKVLVLFKAETDRLRLHSFCGAPGLYKHSDALEKIVVQLLAKRANEVGDLSSREKEPLTPAMREALDQAKAIQKARELISRAKEAITPEMGEALERIRKIHGGMDQKEIDAAVETLHREISRFDPKVFVPRAIPHLMRVAPRDTQTRVLLRRALENGWKEAEMLRACLIQAGDTPGPHLQALVKALDDPDCEVRKRATRALGATGAAGALALPKLRAMVAKANADPTDYDRAYTIKHPMPEHVLAHVAIRHIESELPGVKARSGKLEPWTGAPVSPGKLFRVEKLSTFKRLPKAMDTTLLRLNLLANRLKVDLTPANFPIVLDTMKAIKADDAKYKEWHFAPWYEAVFETAEGRFHVQFYLGGLALLKAPDGSLGLVTFEYPK